MVASAKTYDSIPNNLDNNAATSVNNNNNNNDNNKSEHVSDESSTLLSGGFTSGGRMRSPWSSSSSSSRSPFVYMAAGFVLAVVVLAVASPPWEGRGPPQALASVPTATELWGRARETVDDDHMDDDSGHTKTHTRTFEADVDSDLDSDMSSSSSSKVPKCSFLDCWKAKCSWTLAPYVCLKHNGGPHMGCSSGPWEEGTCDEQCDLSSCDGMKLPEADADTYSCKHKQCSKEWCCGGQTCDSTSSVTYQCVDGSARYGCHDDPLQWTIKVDDATCSECCDAKTCSSVNATVCETFVVRSKAAVHEAKTSLESSASTSFFYVVSITMMAVLASVMM